MRTLAAGLLLLGSACAGLQSTDRASSRQPHVVDVAPTANRLPTQVPTSSPAQPDLEPPKPTPTDLPDPARPLSDEPSWTFELAPEGVFVMNEDRSGRRLLVPYQPMIYSDQGVDYGFDPWFDFSVAPTGWTAVRVAGVRDDRADPRLFIFKLPELDPAAELPLLADELRPQRFDGYYDMAGPEMTDDVNQAIHESWLRTLVWSPQADRLAFVAATDGPSADLYLYDTAGGEVVRLTDGPNQPQLMDWSPDGKLLLHQEITNLWSGDGYSFDALALWATATDGSGSFRVLDEAASIILVEWTSASQFLAVNGGDDIRESPYGLELIDLRAGRVRSYLSGTLRDWAFDPSTQTVAFMTEAERETDTLAPGLYLLPLADPTPRRVDLVCPEDFGQLCQPYSVGWSPDQGAFRIGFYQGGGATMTAGGLLTFDDDA